MHPADRERFKLLLWSVQGARRRRACAPSSACATRTTPTAGSSWRRPACPTRDRRSLRCVGLMREVTDAKRAQERLLHDAVHDSLTGLPNRELFLDRLAIAAKRATLEPLVRPGPAVHRHRQVQERERVVRAGRRRQPAADRRPPPAAATWGRRIRWRASAATSSRCCCSASPSPRGARHAGRAGAPLAARADQHRRPGDRAHRLDRHRRSTTAPTRTRPSCCARPRSPCTAPSAAAPTASRSSTPRCAPRRTSRVALESELRARHREEADAGSSISRSIYLPTEKLAGFEALVRWEHPTLGTAQPRRVHARRRGDAISSSSSARYVLARAVREAARWQKELPRPDDPLFVGVNVSSRQLFRPELVKEMRHILGRAVDPEGLAAAGDHRNRW